MINLEIKVAISNGEAMRNKISKLKAENAEVLSQTDTYFLVGKKRLKLREEKNKSYMVYYVRPDTHESKFSKYRIIHIPFSCVLLTKKVLTFFLGIKVVVEKRRELYMYKHTRIHLDTVKDIGVYLELETVFKEGVSEEDLKTEHYFVMESLGLQNCVAIKESYSDLMIKTS